MGKQVPENLMAYFGLCKFFNILSKFEKLRFFIAHPLIYWENLELLLKEHSKAQLHNRETMLNKTFHLVDESVPK